MHVFFGSISNVYASFFHPFQIFMSFFSIILNSHDKFLINFKNLCHFFLIHLKILWQILGSISILNTIFFDQFQILMHIFLINFKFLFQFFDHFPILRPTFLNIFKFSSHFFLPFCSNNCLPHFFFKLSPFFPPRFLFFKSFFHIFASHAPLMWLGDSIGTQFARKPGWAKAEQRRNKTKKIEKFEDCPGKKSLWTLAESEWHAAALGLNLPRAPSWLTGWIASLDWRKPHSRRILNHRMASPHALYDVLGLDGG